MNNYDLIVIGSGPGGYAAAIRGAQLGKHVAIVEAAELGGVCLNWGCIPTKALLKSASVYEYAKHAQAYGVSIEGEVCADIDKIVDRSRAIAATMSKGIEYLMTKNKIDVHQGRGSLVCSSNSETAVSVVNAQGETVTLQATDIIIATGARPREIPTFAVDGTRIINSRHALTLRTLPESMVVIGSGAIGVELASFFNTLGVKVTIVEFMSQVAPLEDEEISKQLDRALRKSKITVMTSTSVTGVVVPPSSSLDDGQKCKVTVEGKKGVQVLEADIVLSAVGIVANIENIGLETAGIDVQRGKIVVDTAFKTARAHVYAIGDVIATPALAHVATAEAINCVEQIAGLNPQPINYNVIPSCIYTTPEVSSVGMTEAQALAAGHELRIGRFPYTASGKATAAGARDGMVKLIFDAKNDVILGAHFIGLNVTELVAEPTLAMSLGAKASDFIHTIHPHPTMSEAVMEAAAAAHGEAVHL